MAKFLLLIAIVFLAYLFIRAARAPRKPAENKTDRRSTAEDMVRCKICGVHLPRSESVTSRGEFFCSREHLKLADKGQSGS